MDKLLKEKLNNYLKTKNNLGIFKNNKKFMVICSLKIKVI